MSASIAKLIDQGDYDACFTFNVHQHVFRMSPLSALAEKLIAVFGGLAQKINFSHQFFAGWLDDDQFAILVKRGAEVADDEFIDDATSLQGLLVDSFDEIAEVVLGFNGDLEMPDSYTSSIDLDVNPVFQIEVIYDLEVWGDFLREESVQNDHTENIVEVLSDQKFSSYIKRYDAYWDRSLKLTLEIFSPENVDVSQLYYAFSMLESQLDAVAMSGQKIYLFDAHVLQSLAPVPFVLPPAEMVQ